jgi:hypothetical protein
MAKARTPRSASKKNGNSGEMQGVATAPALAPEGKRVVVPINLDDEIRRRAYEIYEQRGCSPGNEHEDWLQAEREVLARYQQTA